MTIDVTGFGTQIQLRASRTFPAGFTVAELADDADPFDSPSIQIGDGAMGVNGDLISWAKGNPIKIMIAVPPNSEADRNLAILANANRVGKNKFSANDEITATVVTPAGKSTTYIKGFITDAPFGDSVSSSSRLKTKVYGFMFENIAGTLF